MRILTSDTPSDLDGYGRDVGWRDAACKGRLRHQGEEATIAQLKHVLDGYKVLDFTQYLAGPTATRMMAQMGAEVVKVELAPHGDPTRAPPYLRDGRSAYYIQQNRCKKSFCVDMRNPRGLHLIKALIPKVDAVIENYAPGVISKMGLSYETVRTLNPAVVMCSISSLRQTGPLADRLGCDTIGAAYAGMIDMSGYPDRAYMAERAVERLIRNRLTT